MTSDHDSETLLADLGTRARLRRRSAIFSIEVTARTMFAKAPCLSAQDLNKSLPSCPLRV